MMTPVEQLWWLRPVMRAARVGEHSAVVWKRLYLIPRLASLSNVGVGIGPPKVLAAPKPTSSVMMSKTFGAPLGALTSLGKSGLDVRAMRSIWPLNGASGLGRDSSGCSLGAGFAPGWPLASPPPAGATAGSCASAGCHIRPPRWAATANPSSDPSPRYATHLSLLSLMVSVSLLRRSRSPVRDHP